MQNLLLWEDVETLTMLTPCLQCLVLMHVLNCGTGTPQVSTSTGFERVHYETSGLQRHFWWIHLIGLLWTSEFILACQQFVIAGTVAVWYFTRYIIILM